MTTGRPTSVPGRRTSAPDAVITDARPGRSRDLTRRQRRYLITMGFRIACFLAMIVVPGTGPRLALLVAATILPAIAVLVANTVDRRTHLPQPVETGAPEQRKALPQESTEIVSGEVLDD